MTSATTTTGITQRFAEFILHLKYEDLPSPVVTQAKNGIVDLLGVALVGSVEESTRMVLRVTAENKNGGEATVLGTDTVTVPTVAAMINGHAAHALDYDDFQHKIGTHMSAAMLPAALVLAEVRHRTGKELLTAYVAGFEIGCRLGRIAGFANHLLKCGVHSTGYLGHFGAAAAAGRIMELDVLQMKRNFGIVAGHAAGLVRALGNMCKAQNAGNAAHNGVVSALLAKEGFTGAEDIFDGEQNIFSIFGAKTDPVELMQDLGVKFEISDNTPKIFACSGWRNPIVEAAMLVAVKNDLKPAMVKKVVVYASKDVKRFANYADPTTGHQGKFSTEHCAAVGLVDRAGGIEQFSDERVNDAEIKSMGRKVTMEIDDALQPHQIRVVVQTTDGRELSHFIPAQKGDPRNPISHDDLVAKFRANASPVLAPKNVDTLVQMLDGLEQVKDVAEVMRLCRSVNAAH